jgi:hypothetical protein
MRVTIVRSDGLVSVNGVAYAGLDLSFIPVDIHAVQWYGSSGEVEYVDPMTNRMLANTAIESITAFQQAIDLWETTNTQATPVPDNLLVDDGDFNTPMEQP